MANIKVHEDPCYFTENVRPKNVRKVTNNFPGQNGKKRTALQPLCSYQQIAKCESKRIREKEKIVSKKQDMIPVALPDPCMNLRSFKPVLKKPDLVSRPKLDNEYEEEILNYLFVLEKKIQPIKAHYMTKQPHITWEMRSILIDWLVSVSEEYQLSENSIHLCANYLDRFLSNLSVIREKFQLVGATSMMIAGKMDEIYPIDIKEWSYLTGDAFSVKQITKMEQLMLKILNFEMNGPTMLDFIKHICHKHKIDNKTMYLAMYLCELVLLEGDSYLQYFPSKLAASSLALARHTLSKPEPWNEKLQESAGYSLKQLSPVVQKQQKTFKSSPFKKQQAIQKKYASSKYQRVALLKPRVLVLDNEED